MKTNKNPWRSMLSEPPTPAIAPYGYWTATKDVTSPRPTYLTEQISSVILAGWTHWQPVVGPIGRPGHDPVEAPKNHR